MKGKILKIALAVLLISATASVARENVNSGNTPPPKNTPAGILAGCSASTAQKDLDINNVRARVLVGGDMWWDLVNAQYEVPKGSNKTVLFAGALWIGGIDAGGQVKVAAQTYRQTGNDFWGGPIELASVSITSQRCIDFDRHWRVRKADVAKFKDDPGFEPLGSEETESKQNILEWPGNGRTPGEDNFLAPFEEVLGHENGLYEPQFGEYPRYNFSGLYPDHSPTVPKIICNDYIFGDQTIWWVFNDVGNVHTETLSDPIGMEIRAQAFAFKTNDEINDMTFYKYQIINRSTFTLTETYFGQWADPDLGNAGDDYVGCDVKRGLGFCYNADADDDGATGYGLNPPAIGIDFFQGPVADLDDDEDNDRDGCEDCTYLIDPNTGDTTIFQDTELPEQIIMSKFLYYVNDNSAPNGNPFGFAEFYNYLRGIWRDGIPMTHSCTGRDPGAPANFMYPGNFHGGSTDPGFTDDLNEVSCGIPPTDGRMLQSAGAFTLLPGAVNYITTGVVWRRTTQGGPLASVELIKLADDKAQALFDNCFKLLDGPDAPNLVIRELDKQLIVSLQNPDTSVERYSALDPTIIDTTVSTDAKKFKFQGYQVFQLKDATVAVSDFKNPDKARLLFQCDIKDSISRIINYTYDPAFNSTVPSEEVNGINEGISHTFKVDQDLFASGNNQLVNHKTYFYTAVSYAYNNYKTFKPDSAYLGGQQKPYLAGRNNIKTYTAIPHIPAPENSGSVLNAEYGDGPRIRRIEGQGNGGMILDFTEATISEVLSAPGYRSLQAEYIGGKGPIDVKVYDPVLVKGLNFVNKFSGVTDTDRWTMIEGNVSVAEDTTINQIYEQVLSFDYKQTGGDGKPLQLNWGISANIHTVIEAGKTGATNNAFLEGTIEYGDNTQRWLNSLQDQDGNTPENWIRSGALNTDVPGDEEQVYEGVIDGTWAPVKLTSNDLKGGPKPPSSGIYNALAEGQMLLSPSGNIKTGISSVDLVITNDKSKWSRAAVIEMGADTSQTIGKAFKYNLRNSPSVDKNGNNISQGGDPGEATSVSDTGMSWFPGYAYNLETGERLNIAFGENSLLPADNGTNMKWDPSSRSYGSSGDTVFGGMHYIYIFGHNANTSSDIPMYDLCQVIFNKLDSAAKTSGTTAQNLRRAVWKDAMWVTIPIQDATKEFLATDVTVRLRVAKTYRRYNTNTDVSTYLTAGTNLTPGTPYYVVSGTATYAGIGYLAESFFVVPDTAGTDLSWTGTGIIAPTQNGANPMYTFATGDLAASLGNVEAAKDALDLINIVPNPYYAYSAYEGTTGVGGQLDNRIKITNLPPKCTISIFTMSGTLIRRYQRDVDTDNSEGGDTQTGNSDTTVDWDLKNTNGISIASGIYLIHIEVPSLGERTLKWFGMLRPIDLDTF